MGFLKHFRSKSRAKEKDKSRRGNSDSRSVGYHHRDITSVLDRDDLKPVLHNIFSYVCPQALNRQYSKLESCSTESACMLCDLRDLAHCALVKRRWNASATYLLYNSIRIDAVHYCDLEEILSEKRQRRSRHGDREDVPTARLRLLSRTVRENAELARLVEFIRLPYMTREGHVADLARTVSVLPSLRYVDLPTGFFSGDKPSYTLRHELQYRCPEIRKMKYKTGSEQYFDLLGQGYWSHIEILDLRGLKYEASMLRKTIPWLAELIELKLTEMNWLADNFFLDTPSLPNLPPLARIVLEKMPGITSSGLLTYLSHAEVRNQLKSLTLKETGVKVDQLHLILSAAHKLETLSIFEAVQHALPLGPRPPMTSASLKIFYFEIHPSSDHQTLEDPSESYYQYLNASLHTNSLPELRELYVRNAGFPELLLLAPPAPAFAADGDGGGGLGMSSSFPHTLEIFSKGPNDVSWAFTSISPSGYEPPTSPIRSGFDQSAGWQGLSNGANDGSAFPRASVATFGGFDAHGRPTSTYSAYNAGTGAGAGGNVHGLGPRWHGGGARRSVVVGNEFGNFLAVPTAMASSTSLVDPATAGGAQQHYMAAGMNPRPLSAAGYAHRHEKRGSRIDLWR